MYIHVHYTVHVTGSLSLSLSLPPPPVEYSQVDWHEFILVETITFRENEAGEGGGEGRGGRRGI